MQHLAILSNLDIAVDFQECITRLKSIIDGTFKVKPSAGIEDPDARKYAEDVADKIEEIRKRPPVGSLWEGEIGKRLLKLNKAMRELTENGVSIRSELGVDADEKITSLLRYFPLGGEVRVARDGAIMGFKKGDPYLIGWLGDVPSDTKDTIRGFYLEHRYVYRGGDIYAGENKDPLSNSAAESTLDLLNALKAENLVEDTQLKVTTYGDLVIEQESEIRKLAEVHKDIWFPGHLESS